MTKVRILVSQLMTEEGLYRNGDVVDFDEDKVKRLGSSVIRIDQPTTENKPIAKPKPEPKKEPKKKPAKVEYAETEISLPPRRKAKTQNGK